MNPITVKLPNVKASGGRKGWNKLIVGVNQAGDMQGEFLEGDMAEMLPGDVLLSVKPIGTASSHEHGVLIYVADEQAHGNLKLRRSRTDWPACKDIVAADVHGMLKLRPEPDAECPACDAELGLPAAFDVQIGGLDDSVDCAAIGAIKDFREAADRAIRSGIPGQVLAQVVWRVVAERTAAG